MILPEQLTEIGRFNQPHGINGELNAAITPGVDLDTLRCIVVDIDGIMVPFFMDSTRRRNHATMLVKLEGVDSDTEASRFNGHTIYALTDELGDVVADADDDYDDLDGDDDPGDGFYAEDLIGFAVKDIDGDLEGEITEVDDATDNILFVVTDTAGNRILIPVSDEFIEDIDTDNRVITFNLPDGLVEMQKKK